MLIETRLLVHYESGWKGWTASRHPVPAGRIAQRNRGSGDRSFDIYPGRPDESIIVYRMQHSDPDIAMPELGRSAVHAEGVAAVSEWIAGMNGDC